MRINTILARITAAAGALLAVLAVDAAANAEAAYIEYSGGKIYSDGYVSETVTVPAFDARIGTLRYVGLDIIPGVTVAASATAYGLDGPWGNYYANVRALVGVDVSIFKSLSANSNFSDLFELVGLIDLSCQHDGYCGSDEVSAFHWVGELFEDYMSLELAKTNWEFSYHYNYRIDPFLDFIYCFGRCDDVDVDFAVVGSSSFWRVTYDYEPAAAPVPLPAGGALMFVGLSVIAIAGRRRSRNRRAA